MTQRAEGNLTIDIILVLNLYSYECKLHTVARDTSGNKAYSHTF